MSSAAGLAASMSRSGFKSLIRNSFYKSSPQFDLSVGSVHNLIFCI